MNKIIPLALAVFCLLPFSAKGENSGPPPRLVEAIAVQESDKNPLAINVAGKSYFPATREEAALIIQDAQAAGKSFDVGLMQVNSWWMERYGVHPTALLDPAVNRAWGEWILAQEIARHGRNWRAVGKYHSPDEERGRRYAWLVYWQLTKGQPAQSMERGNGQQAGSQNIPDPRGVQRHSGVRPQGRVVTFDLQQTGMPGNSRAEPGASAIPHRTAQD